VSLAPVFHNVDRSLAVNCLIHVFDRQRLIVILFSSGEMPCRISLNYGNNMAEATIKFDRDRADRYDLDIRKAIPGYEAVLVSVPLRLTSTRGLTAYML